MEQDVLDAAKISIRLVFSSSTWWQYVQQDARERLLFIIDHVEILGKSFRDIFRQGATFSHEIRKLKEQSETLSKPGALFGTKLPEELYISCQDITKFALGMEDWSKPNEADVQACRQLADQIDLLDGLGIFSAKDQKAIEK